ncbi:MAG TPA: SDR family NAD(P)-dependent oxidoreductase [Chloroflexi bacterium]|nr:SDR family NAD(P)-dependent oxidoreductase [Chloroflexota bacterium]
MRVLVTGAFGNVGTSTVEALLEQGHTVRCFDLKTRTNERAARRLKRQYGDRVEVVWGDLRRREDLEAAVRGQDVVIHLAFIIPKLSHTGVESEARPDWAREINVGGTRNLIEAMKAQPRPPRLIFASSYHVFGRTQDQPPPRTASDPVHPIEHYTHHKIECEEMIRASGLEWAILRLSATLPLGLKLDRAMFDVPLDNRMEFAHTRDVGLAFANAVSSEEVWGKLLLIGGGPRCQLYYRDIVGRVLEALGIGMLPDEAFGTVPFPTDWVDTSESQRILRYQQRDFDDYVREMVALMGFRRHLVRLFRPLARWWLLRRSPYYRERRALAAWRGRVAVVTGASSGIGAETARLLARKGLRVVLVARRRERLERLAAEIRDAGGEATVVVADLAAERERVRLFEAVRMTYGGVDVLVNSAGLGWYGFGADMPWPLARQMVRVNIAAVVHLTLLALAEMKERGRGHVVNIGSVAGSLPSQGVALYSGTKAFVDGFTTGLHRELRGTGVYVSVIRSGPVATEFYEAAARREAGLPVPAERLAVRPAAVAERVWSLLKRPRRIAYVPRWLSFVPWVEPSLGWLLDLIGAPLLRRQLELARRTG